MKIKLTVCTLLIVLITVSVQAAVNPPNVATPKAKAFYLDTTIWANPNIPVCWENLKTITENPNLILRAKLIARRKLTIDYVNKAWGVSGAVSQLNFIDMGQCPIATTAVFNGVRILVSSTASITVHYPFPVGNQVLYPPYVKALGSKLSNFRNGFVLDLNFTRASYINKCKAKNLTPEGCFKASVIHEFGHVIGMSHEQNRSYALGDPLCIGIPDDPSPTPFGTTTIGNIKISRFDNDSIMSYCNPAYPGVTTLSAIDKLAVKTYYGNMPSLNTPPQWKPNVPGTGYPVLRIPVLLINGKSYTAVLSDPTNKGVYNFTPLPTSNKSNTPATFLSNKLTIPYYKRTINGKAWRLGNAAMILHNGTLTFTKNVYYNFPITWGK